MCSEVPNNNPAHCFETLQHTVVPGLAGDRADYSALAFPGITWAKAQCTFGFVFAHALHLFASVAMNVWYCEQTLPRDGATQLCYCISFAPGLLWLEQPENSSTCDVWAQVWRTGKERECESQYKQTSTSKHWSKQVCKQAASKLKAKANTRNSRSQHSHSESHSVLTSSTRVMYEPDGKKY